VRSKDEVVNVLEAKRTSEAFLILISNLLSFLSLAREGEGGTGGGANRNKRLNGRER
jgi:hypothetical protein